MFVDYPRCPCSRLLGRQWARVKGLERVLCTRSSGVEVSLLPDVCLRPAREAAVASVMKTRQQEHQKAALISEETHSPPSHRAPFP